MSIEDKTPPGQSDFIAFEFELKHPPEKVWKALTKPELLSAWLLPAIEHRLEPGAAFRFQAPPQPGWDGRVACRYLDIDEPQRCSPTSSPWARGWRRSGSGSWPWSPFSSF